MVVDEFLECTVAANQGSSSSKNPGKPSCKCIKNVWKKKCFKNSHQASSTQVEAK